jgi:hypothetical protein
MLYLLILAGAFYFKVILIRKKAAKDEQEIKPVKNIIINEL